MDVEKCYFHYSFANNTNCRAQGCPHKITGGAFRVKCEGGIARYYSHNFYHFDCFFKSERCFKKDEIMVQVNIRGVIESDDNEDIKKIERVGDRLYASLETLEKNLPFIKLKIQPVDFERIRRKFASKGLVSINKFPYFCDYSCCPVGVSFEECSTDDFCLMFTHKYFHPKCLAESGVVNIDAKE
uniref:PARP-type domain-containing protein n=1 Tax=Panagrolaimus sp. ES5 TaxID=591445 RepID=A0AC34FGD9_9BILA